MREIQWINMLKYHQELHHFSRNMLLNEEKSTLTVSEMEILSWLYIEPEKSTPLSLAMETGMKKEAVSRSLKKLLDKEFINKEVHPEDKRSYILNVTERGISELNNNYKAMLKPMFDLKKLMGDDFISLFEGVSRANEFLENMKDNRRDNI